MDNPISIISYGEIAETLGDKLGEAFNDAIEDAYHTGKISATQRDEIYANYNLGIDNFIEKLIG